MLSAATPFLTSDRGAVPWIGETFLGRLDNLGANTSGFLLLGDSRTTWGTTPLPLDLTFVGMAGCSLLTNPLVPLGVAPTGGSAAFGLSVPLDPRLVGLSLFAQGGTASASANLLGVVVSNGLTMTLGKR